MKYGVSSVVFAGALATAFAAMAASPWLVSPLMAQQPAVADGRADANVPEVMTKPVTVHVKNVSLRSAITAVSEAAHVRLVYQNAWVDSVTARVTLSVSGTPLGEVLRTVLAGTQLAAVPMGRDLVSIEPAVAMASRADSVITGTVVDAESKRPIAGAIVFVDASKTGVRTDAKGVFRVSGIAPGTHHVLVRHLGYQSYSTAVTVSGDGPTEITVRLVEAVQHLDEVVATAIGDRRRVEIGNSVAHLNVDSIAKTAPIRNVTDLLTGRVPGLQVIEPNGIVGGGGAIRIRGQNSVTLSGDPIIIVDGVRQNNTPGGRYSPALSSDYAAPSPNRLNDIDVNQIETIDVLKGPAAVTEYGTDAANGVILITTKRGQPGPTRWTLSANHGWSDIPGNFPETYLAWGHLTSDPTQVVQCSQVPQYEGAPNVQDGTCKVDSVQHYNPLNHKNSTIYTSAPNSHYSLSVGGGTGTVQYFLQGDRSEQFGNTKVPDVLKPVALEAGFPKGVIKDNRQTQTSASGSFSGQLNQYFTATATGFLNGNSQFAPSPIDVTSQIWPVSDSVAGYGYGSSGYTSPLYQLGHIATESDLNSTVTIMLQWRGFSWLSGNITTGMNHLATHTDDYVLPVSVQYASGNPDAYGVVSIGDNTTNITSGSAQATATFPLASWLRSSTSAGMNIQSTQQHGLQGTTQSATTTNMTLNGQGDVQTTQLGTGSATAGGWLTEELAFADRFFVTAGVRMDGASGFGGAYSKATYPNFQLSWLALNTSTAQVRFRSSLGISGQQPPNGAAQSVWNVGWAVLEPAYAFLSGFSLSNAGNPALRPERSREFEFGSDIDLFDSRISLELTHYRRVTSDQILSTGLGITFNNQNWVQNLGRVENTGNELSVTLRPIESQLATWNVIASVSTNGNKLLGLSPNVILPASDVARFVVGYPLYGTWARRVTYADANHNGQLDTSEVQVADSATYLGTTNPKYTTSVQTNVSFWRGQITLGSKFDYNAGGHIYNPLLTNPQTLSGVNEPHGSLFDQAVAIAETKTYYPGSLSYFKTNELRWTEASMTYNVPSRLVRIARFNNAALTLSVRNLADWTSYPGDPTATNGNRVTYSSISGYGVSNDIRRVGGGSVPTQRIWYISMTAGL